MPAFTPQPQSITALWLVPILPSHSRTGSGWFVTYQKSAASWSRTRTHHPSTNRAQRRLTSLIKTNDVSTTPRRHYYYYYYYYYFLFLAHWYFIPRGVKTQQIGEISGMVTLRTRKLKMSWPGILS